jgi:single-stranded DNA-binding protein
MNIEAINEVKLGGVLVGDAEVKTTGNGYTVASLTVEIREFYREKVYCSRVPVSAWGKLAEECRGRRAGEAVRVEGTLREDVWEKDGKERRRLRVRAARVEFGG